MIVICEDYDLINHFMSLPEITRYSREFGAIGQNYTPDKRELWLAYSVDGIAAGLINLHSVSGSAFQFHPYILNEHKKDYVKMCVMFFKWFDEFMPAQAVKLNAVIPSPYRAALRAAESGGMTKEGTDRMSYRTRTKVCDRILYGITREEIQHG